MMAIEPGKPVGRPFTVDAAFPGGNIVVDGIHGDTVEIHPDLRDTEGNWFYWCFRVRGAAGRRLTFRFTAHDPIGARGPAVSGTDGRSWRWLALESADHSVFSYTFRRDEDDVRFGMGMTYTQEHLERFLGSRQRTAIVRREILCRSRKGRPVELLRLGQLTGKPRFRVLVTARHHACEMMASYELEGLTKAILAPARDASGRWLRDNVEFVMVPFVDKDGVEDGDQGKNRRPRDHNRDYSGKSVYPETGAIRQFVRDWVDGVPFVMFDLHCPYIRDGMNEQIYQVGQPDPLIWARQQRFGGILEQASQTLERVGNGCLAYRQADDLPFGQDWNTAANGAAGLNSTGWAATLPDVRLATSIELPYANAAGGEVNAASARAFGHGVGLALQAFLKSEP